MKAVRITEIGKPLRFQELPVPEVRDRNVLVRVKAAGICRSDVHYRDCISPVGPLPITPGHEVAGIVEVAGKGVRRLATGDRVCVHYLVTCGRCLQCSSGNEQFCVEGRMIGKHCDGGYAEYISVPERNAVPLPPEIPFDQGAVLMCSSATSLHALLKARLKAGESVAVFGIGGLGISAVQLAKALGALEVYAVDINPHKLRMAGDYGAVPVNAANTDPVEEIEKLTGGRGVDVALEVIGLPHTMKQAVRCLGVMGRAALVGITDRPFEVDAYTELLGKEAEIIGCNDHLLSELHLLIAFYRRDMLDLSAGVIRAVPLDADVINRELDDLEAFKGDVRRVIRP